MTSSIAPIGTELLLRQEEIKTRGKLDKVLRQIHPDAWDVVNMVHHGKSYHQIFTHYAGKYSLEEIGYMVNQVVAVNKAVALDNKDMMRQLFIDKLNNYSERLISQAGGIICEKTHNALVKNLEMQAKLLGLNAAEEVKVDITQTIKTANETLADKMANFRKNREPIIDVTPDKNSGED